MYNIITYVKLIKLQVYCNQTIQTVTQLYTTQISRPWNFEEISLDKGFSDKERLDDVKINTTTTSKTNIVVRIAL